MQLNMLRMYAPSILTHTPNLKLIHPLRADMIAMRKWGQTDTQGDSNRPFSCCEGIKYYMDFLISNPKTLL